MEKTGQYSFFRGRRGVLVLAAVLLGLLYAALRLGSSRMGMQAFWGGLTRAPEYYIEAVILYSVRLPRALAAVLAGVGLAVSGVLLQEVTGNVMASPNIIGINSGAGLAVILCLYLFPAAVHVLPFAAFIGAALATAVIVSIAGRLDFSRTAVILAGIALTTLLNAGISFLSLLDTDLLNSYSYFSVGGLSGVRLQNLAAPSIVILGCMAVVLAASGRIKLLCLGDGMAASLGVRVKALRLLCLGCAAASAAAVVSFAGLLGFVGLVVPHIARRMAGADTRWLLVCSGFTGSALVLAADLLGRVLFAPSELPVGIVMAAVGSPFFLVLLFGRRAREQC